MVVGFGRVLARPKFSRPYGRRQTQTVRAEVTPPRLLDDLLGDALGRLGVGVELHRVRGLAGGLRPQVSDVAEHLRQRHESLDHLVAVQVGHGLDMAAPGVQIADDGAQIVLRRGHFDRHDRLQQCRVRLARRFLEHHRAGDLERKLGGVDVVVGAVHQGHLDVFHRIAGEHTELHGVLDPLVNRRDVFLRDPAARDGVDELITRAGLQGSRSMMTRPYCPEPPDCFLWVYSTLTTLRRRVSR